MTAQVQVPRITLVTDAVQVNFVFAFKTLEPEHIQVYLDDNTVPEDPSTYTVVLDGDVLVNADTIGDTGGIVTMNDAPGPGTISIIRNTPMSQETDYTAFDPFPSETHETALDKAMMVAQELSEKISAIGVPAPGKETI